MIRFHTGKVFYHPIYFSSAYMTLRIWGLIRNRNICVEVEKISVLNLSHSFPLCGSTGTRNATVIEHRVPIPVVHYSIWISSLGERVLAREYRQLGNHLDSYDVFNRNSCVWSLLNQWFRYFIPEFLPPLWRTVPTTSSTIANPQSFPCFRPKVLEVPV